MGSAAVAERLVKPPGWIMTIWVIYDHPKDFPDKFVLRPHFVVSDGEDGAREMPSWQEWIGDTLDEVRKRVPWGLACFPRDEGDDPRIVESWL